MPLCSCSTPGRKPGTSTSEIIGILKLLHVFINLAALHDASMSRVPALHKLWFATIPTVLPSILAKPITMFCA